MLSLTIFLPVVGLLLCWALPAKHTRAINVVTNVEGNAASLAHERLH